MAFKLFFIFLAFSVIQNISGTPRKGSSSGSKSSNNNPKLLEVALELVTDLGHRGWANYLPHDIDQDKDGKLSDKEVEVAFKNYMKVIFDTLDQDSDSDIIEEELISAGIDLNLVDKMIDIAFQAYPVKLVDQNKDGLVDSSSFPSDCDFREKSLQGLPTTLCRVWNEIAAYISFEDGNGNRRVNMKRLKSEVKDVLTVIFPLLDQTDDDLISVSDITTLNMKLPEVINLAKKLFNTIDQRTGGDGEIDLANDILGKPLINRGPETLDQNSDGIINLKDYHSYANDHIDRNGYFPKQTGLLGILSRNLDITQDGTISMAELKSYLEDTFKNLDSDDNGSIKLDDIYRLMQKSQFSCLQIEELRAFVERWKEFFESGVDKLLAHFFVAIDQNSDGLIPLEEFYNVKIPCGHVVPCDRLFEEFFFRPDQSFDRDFPQMSNLEYKHNILAYAHPHTYFFGTSTQTTSLEEKIGNAACIVMQPPL